MFEVHPFQARAAIRYLARHPIQCALAIAGIALGTAMVVAIELAQNSARASFAESLVGVFGQSTHRISARNGNVDEEILSTVRKYALDWFPLATVEKPVAFEHDGATLSTMLYGFDPLSLPAGQSVATANLGEFLTTPGTALLSPALKQQTGIKTGDQFTVKYAARDLELKLVGTLDGAQSSGAGKRFVTVDLATAQEILSMPGRLSYISLTAPAEGMERDLDALSAQLPSEVSISAHGRALHSAQALTRAFDTNLDALALLALVVGSFLIYNTMSYLVSQRQPLFARLRALGVTRSSLALQVMYEGWALALLGAILGCGLGLGLATLLLEPLATTLADHYSRTVAPELVLNSWVIVSVTAVVFIVASAATALPAWQASAAPPIVQALHSARVDDARRTAQQLAVVGVTAAFLGCLTLSFSQRSLEIGFVSLGLIVVGLMLVAPLLVGFLIRCVRLLPLGKASLGFRLGLAAARDAAPGLAPAIAAILGAVATGIGIGLMVASFRLAVFDWLEHLLKADIYISGSLAEQATLTEADAARLLSVPGVTTLSKVRRLESTWRGNSIDVTAYELPDQAKSGFQFVAGDADRVWSRWAALDTALISEPFAWHHQVTLGDWLEIETPRGTMSVQVDGIYRDYGNERGVVALDWQAYRHYWGDASAHGFGVYVDQTKNLDDVESNAAGMFAANTTVSVWSNAAIKAESMAVFDRTFMITDAITWLATIIAALATFNALLALNLQQRREHALLRATGVPIRSMRSMLYCQNGVISIITLSLALPLGLLIATLLIEIINVRSFGWSMALSVVPTALFTPVVLAMALTAVASVYPVENASRTPPARHLNDD